MQELDIETLKRLEQAFQRTAQDLGWQMCARIDADWTGEALRAAQDLDEGLRAVKAALGDLRETLRCANLRLLLTVETPAEVKG